MYEMYLSTAGPRLAPYTDQQTALKLIPRHWQLFEFWTDRQIGCKKHRQPDLAG